MKRQLGFWVIGIFMLSLFQSCEKSLLPKDPTNDPITNFEYLWQDVRDRYSYFEMKAINWDSIYSVFKPMIRQNMSDSELFEVLAEMVNQLRDGHVNLASPFDQSRHWDWFLDHPANFNEDLVQRYYLGKDHLLTGPLRNIMIDSILYIYYESFSQTITQKQIDILADRCRQAKGVIVDVRNNGGGNLSNAYLLSSCFSDATKAFAEERVKTGPGVEQFSPWRTLELSSPNKNAFTGSVIVLTNRACYSATTFFAQMMKVLPNTVLLGDQTGGGGGIPVSGQLPNGWTYRMSVTQTKDMNGYQLELGVLPDVPMTLLQEDESNHRDTYIEAAFDIINGL